MVYFPRGIHSRGKETYMKDKQILISVSGWNRDQDSDEEEPIRLLTTGTLRRENGTWRISYAETEPDSQRSSVTLTLDRGVVTMQRLGEFSSSMVFEKGRRFESSYQTPYGALDMGIYATQVKYRVEDEGPSGEVQLQYQLDLQGQYAAMHDLHIRFCPAKKA